MSTSANQDSSFKPTLGLFDATMIVAGSMIGSGIFIVSADMLKDMGSAGWLLAAWIITGFMTLTAALSYGELSAMYPKAGGQYVYLKAAYNPFIGFLYGWSFFAVIQTGTIAAVAATTAGGARERRDCGAGLPHRTAGAGRALCAPVGAPNGRVPGGTSGLNQPFRTSTMSGSSATLASSQSRKAEIFGCLPRSRRHT